MAMQLTNTGITANSSNFSFQSSSASYSRATDQGTLPLTYEADESSPVMERKIILPHAQGVMNNAKNFSDTDAEYYMMKSEHRKNQKSSHPSKIEFQMVNHGLKQKLGHGERPSSVRVHYVPSQLSVQEEPRESLSGKIKKFFSPRATKKDIDVEKGHRYFFDHSDSEFLRTTDDIPHLVTSDAAERVSYVATKFWAEFFGSINVGVAFFIVFFLQLYRFILYSIVRSIIVGFLQMTSDYFVKPMLTALFNGAIQPVLVFLQNILQSLWNTLEPLAQMILGFCMPFIECLRAIRLVDVNVNSRQRGENSPNEHADV